MNKHFMAQFFAKMQNFIFGPFLPINIYHKGCGTMGVPVFASENIELTFAFNFKKYQPKNIAKSYKLHATTSSKARFLNNIF